MSGLVLVELRDGNYVPVAQDAARGGFAGLDADGEETGDPGAAANPRAYPPPFLDSDDYLARIACAACSDVADDLLECLGCGLRGCSCDVAIAALPCGGPGDGEPLCAACRDAHAAACRVCA